METKQSTYIYELSEVCINNINETVRVIVLPQSYLSYQQNS